MGVKTKGPINSWQSQGIVIWQLTTRVGLYISRQGLLACVLQFSDVPCVTPITLTSGGNNLNSPILAPWGASIRWSVGFTTLTKTWPVLAVVNTLAMTNCRLAACLLPFVTPRQFGGDFKSELNSCHLNSFTLCRNDAPLNCVYS